MPHSRQTCLWDIRNHLGGGFDVKRRRFNQPVMLSFVLDPDGENNGDSASFGRFNNIEKASVCEIVSVVRWKEPKTPETHFLKVVYEVGLPAGEIVVSACEWNNG